MTSYRKVITKLYCKLLGEEFKIRFKEKQILQNQSGYESYEKEVDLLSETTVGQILKGKRNISFNASLAFQTSLDYKHPRDLFFPNNISQKEVSQFIEKNKEIFLCSLSNFISDFPAEETSHQIAEKLTDWLSELACLISQI